jgi:hypothetical protein
MEIAMTLTVLSVLSQARELIRDDTRWCRMAPARDQLGDLVSPRNPKAVSFCAEGAVERIVREHQGPECLICDSHSALNREVPDLFPQFTAVYEVNDRISHSAVLEVFDAAIARAKRSAPERELAVA